MRKRLPKILILTALLTCTVFVGGCGELGLTCKFALGPVASFLEFETFALYGLVVLPVRNGDLVFSFWALLLNLGAAFSVCVLLVASRTFDRLFLPFAAVVACFSAALIFPLIQGIPLNVLNGASMREIEQGAPGSVLPVSRGMFAFVLLVLLGGTVGKRKSGSAPALPPP